MTLPLFSLIHKDLKVFFRSKVSACTIILIPLLIILMAGFSFNTNELSNIEIGTYSTEYSNLSENIINELESSNYANKKFNSLQECIDSIKSKGSEICIEFKTKEETENNKEKIIFHVDYSRINLADTLIQKIETQVDLESSTLGIKKAQDILTSLEQAKQKIEESKNKIKNSKDTAEEIQQMNSELTLPSANLNSLIDDLEDAKETSNNSNTQSKIESTITSLESLLIENEDFESSLNKNLNKQKEILPSLDSSISKINEALKILEKENFESAEGIASPVDLEIESINMTENKRDYLIPIILAIVSLFGGILLSSSFVIKNKKTRAFFRNFMTPTKDFTFILGTLITCVIILAIQFGLIFLGIKYILKINIFSMPLELFTILLLSFTSFIFIGMFIGYLFKTEETIIFASMIIATILMVFSNTIIPIENISSNLQRIASLNPVIILEQAMKKIILFNLTFKNLYKEMIILGSTAVIFMGLTYLFRRLTRRNL